MLYNEFSLVWLSIIMMRGKCVCVCGLGTEFQCHVLLCDSVLDSCALRFGYINLLKML